MTDPGRPWSAPRNGIQIRLTTDRPAYRRGDAIALQLSFRNVDVAPWVLSMSPWTSPPVGQFADSPMYGLRTLEIRRVDSDDRARLSPLSCNRLMGERLDRLEAGETRTTHGLLTTSAWNVEDDKPRIRRALLAMAPGRYVLTGRYEPDDLAQLRLDRREGADALRELEHFFKKADASVEAFWAARFMGLSYRGAELVRDAGFRLWSGALDTPPCELVLGP